MGSKNAPIGYYGWSMDLLVHDRGASDKEDTLMWQLARLCARIGAGAVPDAVYYMLVSG